MIRLTMKPAPPVTRYTFEPLVIISDEDCMERMILYFKICGEMFVGFEIYETQKGLFNSWISWFEHINQ